MKVIDRYVGRQVLLTSAFAVAVLSVVLVLGNIFKELLNLLVKNDAPMEFILSFIAYILPFSLTFTIPWGFLTAVLLVFGKMSAENELVALKSNGVSILRICLPVALLAMVCVGICMWINVDVAPRAQKRMKEAVFNIATSNPLAMFGSDRVINEFPGRKIYVERHEGKNLFNLLVYELDADLKPTRVVFARRGTLETDIENKRVLMHLYDARFEQRDDQEPDNLMKIKQGITMQETVFPISLQELYEKNKKKEGASIMTVSQLLQRQQETGATSALKTEVSKRFCFSLASLAFALLAVPLAITAHRKETSIGFGLSLIVAFVYFFCTQSVDWVRNNPKWHPEYLIWAPNVLFIGLGSWMFYRLNRK
jgi:lipopolysaccharide export LptBFGC system permease protein LptF